MKVRTLAIAVAAIVASISLAVVTSRASASPIPPVLGAQHAFIGDPLFGLDTPQGTLYSIVPDDQTAMASTTKIWTLDLTANFLDQGVVHLDDPVTINAYESSFDPKTNSLMTATNGKSLEAGEVVKLRDLIRGMIYQSGNDAAFAIADHIAQALWGPVADWHDFVALMNLHASALGQTHTHFVYPNGWDNPQHYTSARDLASEFEHAMQNPFFAKVVGFSGTYMATTTGAPEGTKTYALAWGRAYTGWEGEKGGSTPNCNGGNAGGCIGAAATRIGRRVVISGMQMGLGDVNSMFDYGFASIFNPDPRATSSPLWTGVDKKAMSCWGTRAAVTAVLPPSGPVSLALWNANVDGSTITKTTQTSLPGSGYFGRISSGDVAVTRLPSGDIILATRIGANVTLSRWAIARDGSLQLLASGIPAGTATTMGLQPVYGDTLLTAMTEPGGALVLKSWRLQGTSLVNLDTFKDTSRTFTEVAIAGPQTTDPLNGHRAVTASINNGVWSLVHDVWGVDQATGAITRLGEDQYPLAKGHVTIAPIAVAPAFDGEFPPAYYAVGYQNAAGIEIRFIRIDGSGTPVEEGTTYTNGPIPGDRLRLAPFASGGVMSAISEVDGTTRLVAWDTHRNTNDTITATSVAQQYTPQASSLDLCRLDSAHAEGDYLTATKDADGLLRLRAYRSGDRPY